MYRSEVIGDRNLAYKKPIDLFFSPSPLMIDENEIENSSGVYNFKNTPQFTHSISWLFISSETCLLRGNFTQNQSILFQNKET